MPDEEPCNIEMTIVGYTMLHISAVFDGEPCEIEMYP